MRRLTPHMGASRRPLPRPAAPLTVASGWFHAGDLASVRACCSLDDLKRYLAVRRDTCDTGLPRGDRRSLSSGGRHARILLARGGRASPNGQAGSCFMMSVAVRFVCSPQGGGTRRSAAFLPPYVKTISSSASSCTRTRMHVLCRCSFVASCQIKSSPSQSRQIHKRWRPKDAWLELLGILGLRSRVGRPSPETQWQALSKRRGVSRLLIGRAKCRCAAQADQSAA